MLSVVSGNTPEARSRALDVLLRAAPDAVVLSISVQGDGNRGYPCVQRIVTSDDDALRDELCRAGTGDPAVIVRQDLEAIARRSPRPHVVLSLPENLDAAALLASLWQPPPGRTPTAHHYDLAATTMGVDPGRFLSDLRCVHRSAPFFGPGRHTAPVTLAEAAARQVEAAGTLVLRPGQDPADGRRQGVRALLGHLNPSATVLAGDSDDADALKALVNPDPRWAEANPAERLDPVLAPVRRRGVDQGMMSVLWRSRRPVHPERLADSLPKLMSGVVRSRGHLWLGTRPRSVVSWRSAGGHLELREAGDWLQDGDASAWRAASPQRRTLASWFWDEYYGERRNEIVFTGTGLDQDGLRRILDATLLDDRELSHGVEAWAGLPDPLLGAPAPGVPTDN
ncbi:GTP-binding protein [Streptomyces natalensis]|uniref:Aromatic ring-opening dioxygenase LigA n=1 Tax=Streptomyces natalensis ATCC 27448 TaxID=1240678 RepID=A0A0D7CLU8_9ACTN|nr:GTP-binding protein [Streptomyces natalensis]KIZ16422.1 aromatic ring-opening dioxygenase LigA [Streptomyces natalensis ATCC 27448]